jgi:hypothetical protein
MPLETIGSYAVAGSTGANARGARQSLAALYDSANDTGFAASSARGGDSGGSEEVRLPSSTPNVAVYLSPFIRLDLETRLAIVEFRNSQTGAVEQQYPSPRVVEEYKQNLPDSSELAPAPQDTSDQNLQPQIVGPNEDSDKTGSATASNSPSSATAAAAAPTASTAAPSAQAAAAAFNAAQSTPAPSNRQVAVA